jgi:hypothetical protein
MKKDIQHNFKTKCHDLQGLFKGVSTLSRFMNNLEKQSLIDPGRYPTNNYLGDGFEFFIELLLKLHPVDNRLGIYNYTPIQENDNGVDGIGVNINLEPSVVQIKYRSNKKSMLTATNDHLSNLFSDGMLAHNVVADSINLKNYRHFVFTTADGLHFYTDQEMFKSKVKTFGYKDIKGIVDKNHIFWEKLTNLIK